MTQDVENGKMGQSFESFLKEDGRYEETMEIAIKRVLAYQLAQAMEEQHISKVEMAKRLDTSRSQLDRLLDPNYTGITISMLARAAKVIGRDVRFELV